MKQVSRLVLRPKQFFNQLQWSSHHWFLMTAFAVAAVFEAQLGRQQDLYTSLAVLLERTSGLQTDTALWIVAGARVGLLLLAAFSTTTLVWLVGSLFGRKSSRRVLFRRLSVVFTVALGGYAAQHMMASEPSWVFAVIVAYLWSALLGYYALREQFGLNHPETMALGLFLLLATSGAWHWSNRVATFTLTSLETKALRQAVHPSKQFARPVPKAVSGSVVPR